MFLKVKSNVKVWTILFKKLTSVSNNNYFNCFDERKSTIKKIRNSKINVFYP